MSRPAAPPSRQPSWLAGVIAGDSAVSDQLLARAAGSEDASLLVAAAVLTGDEQHLVRAGRYALSTRERQLVVLVDAALRGDSELFDVLAAEHLGEHPDHLLACWVVGSQRPPTHGVPPRTEEQT